MANKITCTLNQKDIDSFGSISFPFDLDYFKQNGYEIGDIVKVNINGRDFIMPITAVFNQVGFSGETICSNEGYGVACINKNFVGFVCSYGYADKVVVDGNITWKLNNIDKFEVSVEMQEKYGYLKEYKKIVESGTYSVSNNRDDYPLQNDEQFANFRSIGCKLVKTNLIYRGASPYDDFAARISETENCLRKYGIKSVISLVSRPSTNEYYPDFDCRYINELVHSDFMFELNPLSKETLNAIKKIIEFVNDNEGPYYIHCTYGRDRTGILCAMIAALLGDSLQNIDKDYAMSFALMFNIDINSKFCKNICETVLHRLFAYYMHVDSLDGVDIKKNTYNYFLSSGINEDQLKTFISKIAK